MSVSDYSISLFVGLETYKALHYRWPQLYKAINHPMTPKRIYVELVDLTSANINDDIEQIGQEIKDDLIRLIRMEDLTNLEYSPASRLVKSSQAIKFPDSSPANNMIFIIIVSIISFTFFTLLWISGFIEFIYSPAPEIMFESFISSVGTKLHLNK